MLLVAALFLGPPLEKLLDEGVLRRFDLIRRTHRDDLPVIYMSGYADDAIGKRGVLDADTVLLQKPFRTEDLARQIRRMLDR